MKVNNDSLEPPTYIYSSMISLYMHRSLYTRFTINEVLYLSFTCTHVGMVTEWIIVKYLYDYTYSFYP